MLTDDRGKPLIPGDIYWCRGDFEKPLYLVAEREGRYVAIGEDKEEHPLVGMNTSPTPKGALVSDYLQHFAPEQVRAQISTLAEQIESLTQKKELFEQSAQSQPSCTPEDKRMQLVKRTAKTFPKIRPWRDPFKYSHFL